MASYWVCYWVCSSVEAEEVGAEASAGEILVEEDPSAGAVVVGTGKTYGLRIWKYAYAYYTTAI